MGGIQGGKEVWGGFKRVRGGHQGRKEAWDGLVGSEVSVFAIV